MVNSLWRLVCLVLLLTSLGHATKDDRDDLEGDPGWGSNSIHHSTDEDDVCRIDVTREECYLTNLNETSYHALKERSKRQAPNLFTKNFRGSCGFKGCNLPTNFIDFAKVSPGMVRSAVSGGVNYMSKMSRAKRSMPVIRNLQSAAFAHAQFLAQDPGVPQIEELALIGMDTAKSLISTLGIGVGQFSQLRFTGAILKGTRMEANCPRRPICDRNAKYRTIDGSCNNLKNPKLGMAQTPLKRLLLNRYEDGLSLPRSKSVSGGLLPNPRVVSNVCIGQYNDEDINYTTMLVAFGQFLDHDVTHVPVARNEEGEAINCCERERLNAEEAIFCFPLHTPRNDPVFPDKNCINFVRSVSAPGMDCQPGPMNQINQITHWIDSSNVYGSNRNVTRTLRAFKDGLLKTVRCQDGSECLPFAEALECRGPTRRCALAGDLRVNEQPTLSVMHLFFVREHNRLARGLKIVNPSWNDEKLFQEARRILNAEWQHIVYNEYLPVHLGERPSLLPLVAGFRRNYYPNLDPRVSNAFAAAGFRIGHTFITQILRLYSHISSQLTRELQLRDVFGNGDLIRENNAFDSILKGLTIQPSEKFDNTVAQTIRNSLFADGELGIDLVALNVQRARDHGLPGYTQYRRACNVGDAKKFTDLGSNIPPEKILLLSQAYKHVDDIDLFIGMLMEDRCPGAFIGCTFACLITDTFERLRHGDRFFYDLADQPGSFTGLQLQEIRKVSLARIICDNSNIKSTTAFSFRQPNSFSNPILFCEDIPQIDLSTFSESSVRGFDFPIETNPGFYQDVEFKDNDFSFE